MPKIAREIRDVELRRIAKPGFHAVGGVSGLLLKVTPTGSRSWVLRTTVGKRRTDIGLGGYPDVPLTSARDRARETKALIRDGIDPVQERRRKRAELIRQQETRATFKEAWEQFWRDRRSEFGTKTIAHWENSVVSYALPVIGSVQVSEIETRHIENVLRPIWETKTVTAKKLRGRLEAILSWATVKGLRQGDNPARWKDNLKEILPRPSKLHKTKHFRAFGFDQMPEFIAALKKQKGVSARAVEFCILTAARSGEVRGAVWSEIDLKKRLWVIPASRMKADKPHHIPLSDAAIKLLKQLPKLGEHVFTAPRGGMLSDMSLLAVLKRMGWYDRTTVHGFRSAFKDWSRQSKKYRDEVSELQLAHVNTDATRAAYARDMLLPQRAAMMGDWARFCEASVTVVKMRAKA